MQKEVAPPFENWEEHLRALSDRDLTQLAKDYRWLDEQARAKKEGPELHARREAVRAECERRGLGDAKERRRPALGGSA